MREYSLYGKIALMADLIRKNNNSCSFEGLLFLIEGGFYTEEEFRESFNKLLDIKMIRLEGKIITNPGDGTGAQAGDTQELSLMPGAKLEHLQYFDQEGRYIESRFEGHSQSGARHFPPNDIYFTVQCNSRVKFLLP